MTYEYFKDLLEEFNKVHNTNFTLYIGYVHKPASCSVLIMHEGEIEFKVLSMRHSGDSNYEKLLDKALVRFMTYLAFSKTTDGEFMRLISPRDIIKK